MVKVWKVTIPELSGEEQRRAYLYLPDSYFTDSSRRYPVMYMFDGHNVFFDSDATYGKSWGMEDFMRSSGKQFIIAAVECNHHGNYRLCEYSPFTFDDSHFGHVEGRGEIYMNWLVNTFKPFIDYHYRTLPQRANTAICGSSMGGLMSIFAVSVYNDVFSRAACLSPSLWADPDGIRDMLECSKFRAGTTVYIDYGSKELSNHSAMLDNISAVTDILLKKRVNVTTRIVPNGTHSEASWEKQIPIFTECLGMGL